jgi:hypothetical protein
MDRPESNPWTSDVERPREAQAVEGCSGHLQGARVLKVAEFQRHMSDPWAEGLMFVRKALEGSADATRAGTLRRWLGTGSFPAERRVAGMDAVRVPLL